MNLNLLKIFTKVAELGSFTAAARQLKQPKSNVSRAVSRIEADLNVQLFKRTTRKISLTLAGNEFYRAVGPLLSRLSEEIKKVSEDQQRISGLIRVTASPDIAQTMLIRLIREFNLAYPDVTFETIITNDFLDLTSENIDLAFRAGRLKESSLIQRKLLRSSFILVCSPGYGKLKGIPKDISELENHQFLSFRGMEAKLKRGKIKLNPVLTSDSLPLLLSLATEDLGITMLPDFFCSELFSKKNLIRVCHEWSSASEPIQLVYPPTKNLPKRVRLFIDSALNSKSQQHPV